MPGHADVFLHLVEFGFVDKLQRVFLTIDDPGLQRAVDLAEVERDGRSAEALEQGNQGWSHRQADLHAGQVIGSDDRLDAGGDVAETVVEGFLESEQALLLHLASQPGTGVAVDRGPVRTIFGEREAYAQDAKGRVARGQDIARKRIHL